MTELRGAFAAAVTPLTDEGTRLDESGIAAVAGFLAEGALVCGTAGEGMVLSVAERRALIDRGLTSGAIGAISALASALPELVVAAVRSGAPEDTARAAAARGAIERFPMPAALKTVCALRGVAIGGDVRAPLRGLDNDERRALELVLRELLETAAA